MPVMIAPIDVELPRPWVLADMVQNIGSRPEFAEEAKALLGGAIRPNLSGEEGEGTPHPLPRISAPGAGAATAMIMGSVLLMDCSESPEPKHSIKVKEEERKLHEAAEKIVSEVSDTYVVGAKIVDKKDEKTVGQVISPPAPVPPWYWRR